MHTIFVYGYAMAGVGVIISAIYFCLSTVNQQQNLRLILENTVFRQLYERHHRNHPQGHKYANRHRTKLITRRLLNKLNQLNHRIHLPSELPRWRLIYGPGGEVRVIPLAP